MYIKRVAMLLLTSSLLCLTVACGDGHGSHDHDHGSKDAVPSAEAGDLQSENRESEEHSHDDGHTPDKDHHDDIRQAGTHLHGEANLAIAVDGNNLVIEFESPVYNLTGFEHAPKTDEQHALVEEVELLLANATRLFAMNSEAGCQARERLQTVSLGLSDESEHESEHEHDKDHDSGHDHDEKHESGHGHDDEHESEHGDSENHDSHDSEHDSDHDAESDHSESHNDVLVEYHYDCVAPEALDEISVQLFKLFPRFEELDVVFLDQTRQRSATLNPNNIGLKLD